MRYNDNKYENGTVLVRTEQYYWLSSHRNMIGYSLYSRMPEAYRWYSSIFGKTRLFVYYYRYKLRSDLRRYINIRVCVVIICLPFS